MNSRNTYLGRFLDDAINGLADRSFQQRVWVMAEGPEVDCYDESIITFFDYYRMIKKDYKKYGLSEGEFEKIKHLEKRIREHSRASNMGYDEEIIAHPLWENVIKAAKDVKQALARFEQV